MKFKILLDPIVIDAIDVVQAANRWNEAKRDLERTTAMATQQFIPTASGILPVTDEHPL